MRALYLLARPVAAVLAAPARLRLRPAWLPVVLVVGSLVAPQYACDDPVSVRTLAPEAGQVNTSFMTQTPGSEHLAIRLVPRDSLFRPTRHDRARIRVEIVGGDSEEILLARFLCPQLRQCRHVLVVMEDDRHANDLAPLLPPLGAVFELISVSGKYAGLVLIDREVDEEVLGIVRRWPGVHGADYSPLAVGIGNTELLYSNMAAVVRVEYGAPQQNDGVLQVSAGDSVTVTYVSASDTTVHRAAVP